jgi:hypothetical protein
VVPHGSRTWHAAGVRIRSVQPAPGVVGRWGLAPASHTRRRRRSRWARGRCGAMRTRTGGVVRAVATAYGTVPPPVPASPSPLPTSPSPDPLRPPAPPPSGGKRRVGHRCSQLAALCCADELECPCPSTGTGGEHQSGPSLPVPAQQGRFDVSCVQLIHWPKLPLLNFSHLNFSYFSS